MKTFINLNDIDLLCNDTKFDNCNNNKKKSGFNEQRDKQGESESQYDRRSTFKEKAKNIWSKVKKIILGGVDVLYTMSSLFKAVTIFDKYFGKMKGVFA